MPESSKPNIADLVFTLHVDDTDHPLVVGDISARQVGELAIGFVLDVGSLVYALLHQSLTARDVAALMFLSARQAGRDVGPDEFLDAVTLKSKVTVTFEGDTLPEVPADLDADPNS